MSKHEVKVVPVVLGPHPNADSLSLVHIGGFVVAVRTEDWLGVHLGAYVPPDSVLSTGERIRAKKLRGIYSEGMLLPPPEGAEIGDDVAEALGVTHYEPEPEPGGSDTASPPAGVVRTYDVENARKYASERWAIGTLLAVTEKIHGQNWRAVYTDGRFHVGSRTRWVADVKGSEWWPTLRDYPLLMDWLSAHPGVVVYGEQYGQVRGFPYGVEKGKRKLAIFDVAKSGRFGSWVDVEALGELGLPIAPNLACIPWSGDLRDFDHYAEGATTLGGGHVREGAVIRPLHLADPLDGERPILKLVGRGYLAKEK